MPTSTRRGGGGIEKKVEELGDAGLEKIVGADAINEDSEASMVDDAKETESFR